MACIFPRGRDGLRSFRASLWDARRMTNCVAAGLCSICAVLSSVVVDSGLVNKMMDYVNCLWTITATVLPYSSGRNPNLPVICPAARSRRHNFVQSS